jgi:hypothetical protein
MNHSAQSHSSFATKKPRFSARKAANFCLLCPLLIVAIALLLPLLTTHFGSEIRVLGIALVYLCCILFLIGAIAGPIALFSATAEERGVVIIRTTFGLALLALIVCMAIPNYLRASHRDKPIQSSGQSAAVMNATRDNFDKVRSHTEPYKTALRQLSSAGAIAPKSLQRREDIVERKTLVVNVLAANASSRDFFAKSELNYSNELASAKIPQPELQWALKKFQASLTVQLPLLLEIQDANDRMAHSMVSILDLLDRNWGHWHYNAQRQHLSFEQPAVVGQYNGFMNQIQQAVSDTASAEKRLADLKAKHSQS